MRQEEKSNDALIAEISKLERIVRTLKSDRSGNSNINNIEERYRYLFEYSNDAILVHTPDGTIFDVNQAALDEFGLPRKRFIGLNIFDLHPHYEHNKLSNIMKSVIGKTCMRAEVHFIKKSGEIFPADITSKAIDVSGEMIVQTIIRDISDIKQALSTLISSEEKFRNIVERSIDGICIIQNNHIKYVNSQLAKIGGYRINELMNITFSHLVNPSDLQRVAEKYEQLKSNKKNEQRFEIAIIHQNGSFVETEITISRMLYKDEYAALVYVRDLTEHNKIIRELHKIQKLESIGVLAGGIAHDFNNILAVILGNMSLALNHVTDPDEIKSLIRETITISERGKNLTKQLLTFSQGGDPIIKQVAVHDLVEESLRLALTGSNIEYSLNFADDIWDVEIDEGQIHQVIHNILVNSLQAMPDGGSLTLMAQNTQADPEHVFLKKKNRYIEIDIIDTGPGIEQDHLPKIFDPFFSTKHECRGLGLSTAYSIVKKHNGYIFVESEPGHGTTVKLYLPAQPPIKSENINKISENNQLSGNACGGRVLIMDDEHMVCKIMKRMLQVKGYESEMAYDGLEAITLFEQAYQSGKPFDLIIMDLTVPGGMGGREAIKKLKQIDPKVKAIVSSGYSNDPIMANCKKYGFADCLTKPYSFQDISKVLDKVIN